MSTLKDNLIAIRKLIANGFCQKHYALDINNNSCSPFSEEAVSFCIFGAMYKTLYPDSYKMSIIQNILGNSFEDPFDIAGFNDTHTQKEVLEFLDRIIDTQS